MPDTPESNKAIVRKILEAFNTGNTGIVADLIDPNVDDKGRHIGYEKELRRGHPIRRLQAQILREKDAFPDRKFKEESIVAEGDTVVLRWSMTGTNKGKILGKGPTNKKVDIRGTEIVRIKDGKIIEHEGDDGGELLEVLRQVGVLDQDLVKKIEAGDPALFAEHSKPPPRP